MNNRKANEINTKHLKEKSNLDIKKDEEKARQEYIEKVKKIVDNTAEVLSREKDKAFNRVIDRLGEPIKSASYKPEPLPNGLEGNQQRSLFLYEDQTAQVTVKLIKRGNPTGDGYATEIKVISELIDFVDPDTFIMEK